MAQGTQEGFLNLAMYSSPHLIAQITYLPRRVPRRVPADGLVVVRTTQHRQHPAAAHDVARAEEDASPVEPEAEGHGAAEAHPASQEDADGRSQPSP